MTMLRHDQTPPPQAVIDAGLALPIGVQVMGKPMNEEVVMRVR